MRLQDYKNEVFAHFNVTSLKKLRANRRWQEIEAQEALTNLSTLKDWQTAHRVVFQHGRNISNIPKNQRPQTTRQLITSELTEKDSPASTKDSHISEGEEFHILEDSQGNLAGALLTYSPQQSQYLIEHFKNLQLHSSEPWHQGKLNPVVVDHLSASSALVSSGLQAGQLFRVVGPPDLISKVASGTHQMIQTSTGALGTISNSKGRIVGQLRFATGKAALPVLAPIVAYQILHAIVGTQQLNQINQRLAKIEHTLQELHIRQEAAIIGEVHYAINVLDDILASRMNTGIFSLGDINRLAHAERTIVSILERNRLLVERFRDKASSIRQQSGKKGARSAAELLASDGPQAIFDMQCLVGLVAADLKLEQALLLLAMQDNPEDVGRRQERIRTKMQNHHAAIKNLPSVYEVEDYAQACLDAMGFWEKLFDFGQTHRAVQSSKKLNLRDIQPQIDTPQASLSGYLFWQDKEGIHAFSMAGEDLQLKPIQETQQPKYLK